MKRILVLLSILVGTYSHSQITTPRLSPDSKIAQTIGLTELEVAYSRPGKRDRVVFGDVVPFDEIWRTGANKNSTITTSSALIFGKDTLAKGTYALYAKPMKSSWELYFYTTTDNWGNPENWEEDKVALKVQAKVMSCEETETFTITFDDLHLNGGALSMSWDKTKVSFPFTVPTQDMVTESIAKTMAGPSGRDYYLAADYYYNEKLDLQQALGWINKCIEKEGESAAFYIYRKKALIEAELGDYKAALASAKISLERAEKVGNANYVEQNKKSIEEWSKKIK